MPKQPAKQPPEKTPRPNGQGALLSGGVPGNKGGPGRPPNEFKEKLRELRDAPATLAYLKSCLEGKQGGKVFMQAMAFVTDRIDGKAPQPITGADGGKLEIVIRDE